MNLYRRYLELQKEIENKYVHNDAEGLEVHIALSEIRAWLKKKEYEQGNKKKTV